MTTRITGRFRRSHRETEDAPGAANGDGGRELELETVELSGVFAAPQWLRDLGFASWMLAGAGVVLVGLVWLMSLTATIVVPVVVAAVLASVLSPLVGFLQRHGVKRGLGAAIVFIGLLVLGAAFAVMVIGGITSQASEITARLSSGAGKIQGWLQDAGVDQKTAQQANSDASSGVSDGFHALMGGIAKGISGLASLAVFLSFTALSLFFLLKDGPQIRRFVERHLGVPAPVAKIVVGRTLSAMRGYFAGVTVVAAFNGVVIGLGAVVLGVPNAGTIAIVNFVAAYIPYVGAWTAGAFTVLLTLSTQGTDAAVVMIVIVLLANGALQQLVQPIAMGAALGIHPLAVLIVTIAGGALFGTIGMVIAAPLTSAAVRITADLAARRKADDAAAAAPRAETAFEPPSPAPAAS